MRASASSVQAARQRLADQLREIREDAGLTGTALADAAGWHGKSKISKIEHAARSISVADLRIWCRVCRVPPVREAELLAELRAVAGMWVTYKRLNRGGLEKAQESVRERYERAWLMRVYANKVIPGLLQTEAYTNAALTAARIEQGVTVDDVPEAVAERVDRQRVLRQGGRFAFVIEEHVLWHRTVPADVHAGQLRHLLNAASLPSVGVGIIPQAADRFADGPGVWPEEEFMITDEAQVNVESVSGYLTVTQPGEVELYLKAWERLSALAVHGARARRIVEGVAARVGPSSNG